MNKTAPRYDSDRQHNARLNRIAQSVLTGTNYQVSVTKCLGKLSKCIMEEKVVYFLKPGPFVFALFSSSVNNSTSL